MQASIYFDDSDDFSEDMTTRVVVEILKSGEILFKITEPDTVSLKEEGKTTNSFSFTIEQLSAIAEFSKVFSREKP